MSAFDIEPRTIFQRLPLGRQAFFKRTFASVIELKKRNKVPVATKAVEVPARGRADDATARLVSIATIFVFVIPDISRTIIFG